MRVKHKVEEELEFQIAPMIDVLLVVLIFFITITSASVLKGDRNLKLPVAPAAAKPATTWKEVLLNIHWEDKKGWVVIDTQRYDKLEDLTARLKSDASADTRFRVLLRADRTTPASYIQHVIEASAGAGISDVVFTALNHD